MSFFFFSSQCLKTHVVAMGEETLRFHMSIGGKELCFHFHLSFTMGGEEFDDGCKCWKHCDSRGEEDMIGVQFSQYSIMVSLYKNILFIEKLRALFGGHDRIRVDSIRIWQDMEMINLCTMILCVWGTWDNLAKTKRKNLTLTTYALALNFWTDIPIVKTICLKFLEYGKRMWRLLGWTLVHR